MIDVVVIEGSDEPNGFHTRRLWGRWLYRDRWVLVDTADAGRLPVNDRTVPSTRKRSFTQGHGLFGVNASPVPERLLGGQTLFGRCVRAFPLPSYVDGPQPGGAAAGGRFRWRHRWARRGVVLPTACSGHPSWSRNIRRGHNYGYSLAGPPGRLEADDGRAGDTSRRRCAFLTSRRRTAVRTWTAGGRSASPTGLSAVDCTSNAAALCSALVGTGLSASLD